ncbi:MAG: sulfite exporter TauE/SafE family protein [bacterium]|nr:sulfite exporter TauE/SafE family protein [bacterium]
MWGLPSSITLFWLIWVLTHGHWERIAHHWEASVTMVFGSFVAGATPQGGGAVAFPVFTKVLSVPAEVARTFSLSIQAVGMVTAALIVLLARRHVETKALLIGGASGLAGFAFGLVVLSDSATPFWESHLPAPYIKVTFTIVLAAMSYIVLLTLTSESKGTFDIEHWNPRIWSGLLFAGFLGGIASALTGSGADVMVFLFAVILCGLHPRVGVPTSILAMASVSSVGLVVLGLIHGELSTAIDSTGSVIAVAGDPVGPLSGDRYDLYGLWLAAIPVVVWGAPLGTWVAHVLHEKGLILLVGAMAAAEVLSTAIFLDDLRTDPALLAYGVLGIVFAVSVISWLTARRHRLLRLEGFEI